MRTKFSIVISSLLLACGSPDTAREPDAGLSADRTSDAALDAAARSDAKQDPPPGERDAARASRTDAAMPAASAGTTRCGVEPALARGRFQMENLCRGVVAVRTPEGNFVSWRLLGYEPDEIAFNVYRDGTRVNASPIADVTHYLDAAGGPGAQYTVRALLAGTEREDSERVPTWPENYLAIPLRAPAGYTAGDTSVGDLDGDGHYELVVKWEGMPRDNSQEGVTGTPKLDA